MLSDVICSKCQRWCVVSNREIPLPFICDSCLEPSAPQPQPECDSCACDKESVEATTRVIEDLQQQLEAERATILKLEAEKADLQEKITSAGPHLDRFGLVLGGAIVKIKQLAEQNEVLGKRCFHQGETIIDYFARNSQLQRELAEAHASEEKNFKTIAKLMREVDVLRSSNDFIRKAMKNFYNQWRAARTEIADLEKKARRPWWWGGSK